MESCSSTAQHQEHRSDRLKFTSSNVGVGLGKAFSTPAATGTNYQLSFDLDKGSCTQIKIEVFTAPAQSPAAYSNIVSASGTYVIPFTDLSAIARIEVTKTADNGVTQSFYLDNIKLNNLTNPSQQVAYFTPEILSATDYYAFGAPMNGRQFNGTSYKYGFNGKENDNEIKGEGNSLDFGARIYDSRLARFLSVDPKWRSFCNFSPYSYAANNPIVNIDEEGESPFPSISMLRAMALAAGYLKSTLSVNTSISVAAGVYASYSKGLAVDSKGNVMIFTTVGGIANGKGLNGGQFGLSSNAGVSASVGGAVLPGAKTVNDLLGTGVYMGGETSIEGLIGVGGGAEILGNGSLAGASANVSFGVSALPANGVVQITNTSGITMNLGEMEKIINTFEKAQNEYSSKYYDLNDNEKTRAGGWGDVWGVWQPGKLEVVTQEAGKNADGQTQYEIVIKGEYFFILNSNGSKEGINPNIKTSYEFKSGVKFTKDSDGNMHSEGEVK